MAEIRSASLLRVMKHELEFRIRLWIFMCLRGNELFLGRRDAVS